MVGVIRYYNSIELWMFSVLGAHCRQASKLCRGPGSIPGTFGFIVHVFPHPSQLFSTGECSDANRLRMVSARSAVFLRYKHMEGLPVLCLRGELENGISGSSTLVKR